MKAKGLWATIFLHECFAIESGIVLKLFRVKNLIVLFETDNKEKLLLVY